jgi:hypothetical protein
MTPRRTGGKPVSQDVRAQIPVLISDLGCTRQPFPKKTFGG